MDERRAGLLAGLSRYAVLLLLPILIVGLWLRCYGIASRSLWYDEANTYFTCRLPFGELLRRLHYDVHPPLYYLLLNVWNFLLNLWRAGLGDEPAALRAPGVFFGAMAIFGVYPFTVEAVRGPAPGEGPRVPVTPRAREIGLWAAALVSLSVFQIHGSWEVRPYGLDVALCAFSSWVLLRAIHARSPSFHLWLLYALLSLLFAYTHYFGLLTIAAQGLFVAGHLGVRAFRQRQATGFFTRLVRQQQFWPALLTAVVIGLCWLPWLPTFLEQQQHVQADYFVRAPSWAAVRIYAYHMTVEPENSVPRGMTIASYACIFVCAAVPCALLCKAKSANWLVFLSAVVPVGASLFTTTILGTHVFYSRYFLFAHLFLLVGAAMLLGKIPLLWARLTLGLVVVLGMLAVDLRYMQKLDLPNSPSYRGAAEYVESRRQPGEPVVVCHHLYYLPLLYHAKSAPGWYLFGRSPDTHDDAWVAFSTQNVMRQHDLDDITGGRVWVVNTTSKGGATQKVIVPKRWKLKGQRDFADRYTTGERDLQVLEYEVPATNP